MKSRNEVARRRWKLLAKALNIGTYEDTQEEQRHIRSYSWFNPFRVIAIKDENSPVWFRYIAAMEDGLKFVNVRYISKQPTIEELTGFNNTGNIRVWQSEEMLAHYALCNRGLFCGKTVLELGGGMTCLAGMFAAKYADCKSVHLTDGNECSVQNVSRIVASNEMSCSTNVFALKWEECASHYNAALPTTYYDVILLADCLFFEDSRAHLITTLWKLLAPGGTILAMAPSRGSTLCSFVELTSARGFDCQILRRYDKKIWLRHVQLLRTCPEYDENIHYPILMVLTKSHDRKIIPS